LGDIIHGVCPNNLGSSECSAVEIGSRHICRAIHICPAFHKGLLPAGTGCANPNFTHRFTIKGVKHLVAHICPNCKSIQLQGACSKTSGRLFGHACRSERFQGHMRLKLLGKQGLAKETAQKTARADRIGLSDMNVYKSGRERHNDTWINSVSSTGSAAVAVDLRTATTTSTRTDPATSTVSNPAMTPPAATSAKPTVIAGITTTMTAETTATAVRVRGVVGTRLECTYPISCSIFQATCAQFVAFTKLLLPVRVSDIRSCAVFVENSPLTA
jgi:hypothetical protein